MPPSQLTDLRRPAAITMWDFSWLERRWPGGGYEDYSKLSEADRTALQGPVTTLAEDLSSLEGTLGLE